MTSTSLLLILIGLFVIINAPNFVGVLKGEQRISTSESFTSTFTDPKKVGKGLTSGN